MSEELTYREPEPFNDDDLDDFIDLMSDDTGIWDSRRLRATIDADRAHLATSEAENERLRGLLTDVVKSADASPSNRKPSSLIHVPRLVMDRVRHALAASPVSDTDREGEG